MSTGHLSLIKLLVEKGADFRHKAAPFGESNGDNALFWACKDKFKDSERIVEFLLKQYKNYEYSSLLNFEDDSTTSMKLHFNLPTAQNNCLMYAAKSGNVEICKLLVKKGADPYNGGYKDKKSGKTTQGAASYAFESQFFECAYFLDPTTINDLADEIQEKLEISASTNDVEIEFTHGNQKLKQTASSSELILKIDGNYVLRSRNKGGEDKPVTVIHYPGEQALRQAKRQGYMNKLMKRDYAFKAIAMLASKQGKVFDSFTLLIQARMDNVPLFMFKILPRLYDEWKKEQPLNLVRNVLELSGALTKAAAMNSNHYLFYTETSYLESVTKRIFQTPSMKQLTIAELFDIPSGLTVPKNELVREAMAFYTPTMKIAFGRSAGSTGKGLLQLFTLPQISHFFDRVLNGNLKKSTTVTTPSNPDERYLYNFYRLMPIMMNYDNSNSEVDRMHYFRDLRYCPVFLFCLEGIASATQLALISYVAVAEYGGLFINARDTGYSDSRINSATELAICVFWLSHILYIFGENIGNTKDESQSLSLQAFHRNIAR